LGVTPRLELGNGALHVQLGRKPVQEREGIT
jgi:hypothetical protein